MHLRRTSFFLAERRDFFIKVNRKNSLVFLKGVSRQQASFLLLYEEEMKDSQFLCFIVERKARLSSSSSSSSEPNLSWSPLSMYLSLSFFFPSLVSCLHLSKITWRRHQKFHLFFCELFLFSLSSSFKREKKSEDLSQFKLIQLGTRRRTFRQPEF